MHIARAHLNQIHLLEQVDVLVTHDLGDNRQTGLLLCLEQQADALVVQSLESVRRGSRFKRAAAQHNCSRLLDRTGNRGDLLGCFDRAGTCDNSKITCTDTHTCHIHHGILRMEFAVCLFVWLLDSLNPFDNIHRSHLADVHAGGVPYQSHQGGVGALRKMNLQSHCFKFFFQLFDLLWSCGRFYNYDHVVFLFSFFTVKKPVAPVSKSTGSHGCFPFRKAFAPVWQSLRHQTERLIVPKKNSTNDRRSKCPGSSYNIVLSSVDDA